MFGMPDHAAILAEIDAAAHSGDFGDNMRPLPSDAQCIAGNYKKGRVLLHGLPIAIEQPRGSVRRGVDKSGKQWESRMGAHYGDIERTRGADGDPVDVFIGAWPLAETAYVINQFVDGSFDEHKVMLAFPDEDSARRAYLNSYERGWRGLKSLVPVSIAQLKWWLKHGNMHKPLSAEFLPQGTNTMKRVTWTNEAVPEGLSLDRVLYDVRLDDDGDGLLLDAVSAADIMADSEGSMILDALVVPFAKLPRQMELLKLVMERSAGSVTPLSLQITDPFKQRGVANVAVIFELSDGQTVSIYFHNPDVTPAKMAPGDELISWKWLLNKKDITIVVAPERGKDLNVREVARRILRLAEKNSAAFARANAGRAARMDNITSLKSEVAELETALTKAQRELEVAQQEAVDRQAAKDRKTGIAEVSAAMEKTRTSSVWWNDPEINAAIQYGVSQGWLFRMSTTQVGWTDKGVSVYREESRTVESDPVQDQIDRQRAVRAALKAMGWESDEFSTESKVFNGQKIDAEFVVTEDKNGFNVDLRQGGVKVLYLPDNKERTPEQFAEDVDYAAKAGAGEPGAGEEAAPAPVKLTGSELGEFPDTPEGKKALRDAAKELLYSMRGNMVPCPAIGREVEIRRRSIKETLAFSADPRKLKLIPAIKEMIGSAVLIAREENHKTDIRQGVVAYYQLKSAASLDGVVLEVRVVIAEALDGTLYYDFIIGADEAETTTALDCAGAVDVSVGGSNHNSEIADTQNVGEPIIAVNVFDSAGGSMVFNLFIEGEAPEVLEEEPEPEPAPAPEPETKPDDNRDEDGYDKGPEGQRIKGMVSLKKIRQFLSKSQYSAMDAGMRGEEAQFFVDKATELSKLIGGMPVTYSQDGKGDQAVAYLHYFVGSADWWVTEKDMEGDGTQQAFGLADLGERELGYISIAEVVAAGAELDLHWTPKTLAEINGATGQEGEGAGTTSTEKSAQDKARVMVGDVAEEFSGVLSGFEQAEAPQWMYSDLTIGETVLRIGVSTGGVVQVNGRPHGADGRVIDNLDAVREAIKAALPKPQDGSEFSVGSVRLRAFTQKIASRTVWGVVVVETGKAINATDGSGSWFKNDTKAKMIEDLNRMHEATMRGGDPVKNENRWRESFGLPPVAQDPAPTWKSKYMIMPQPTGYFRVAHVSNGSAISPAYPTEEEASAAADAYFKGATDFPVPSDKVGMGGKDPHAGDRAFFQTLIDGTADMLAPELADQLEAAYGRVQGATDLEALFEQAVNAYTAAAMKATESIAG